jgi:hypothetical protein
MCNHLVSTRVKTEQSRASTISQQYQSPSGRGFRPKARDGRTPDRTRGHPVEGRVDVAHGLRPRQAARLSLLVECSIERRQTEVGRPIVSRHVLPAGVHHRNTSAASV